MRWLLTITTLALLCPVYVCAQPAAGSAYLAVTPALSAGDGGAAPALSATAGYVTPHHIGFEVEFSYVDRLDMLDEGRVQILNRMPVLLTPTAISGPLFTPSPAVPTPTIFPPIEFTARGRVLALQTNAVGEIVTSRRVRVTVSGGGGVAALRTRTHLRVPALSLPVPFGVPPMTIGPYDQTYSDVSTGLSLNSGMTTEVRLTQRIGLAGDVRYQHVFLESDGLNLARVGARFVWRF